MNIDKIDKKVSENKSTYNMDEYKTDGEHIKQPFNSVDFTRNEIRSSLEKFNSKNQETLTEKSEVGIPAKGTDFDMPKDIALLVNKSSISEINFRQGNKALINTDYYTALLRMSHANTMNHKDTNFEKLQANSKNTHNDNDYAHNPLKDISKANTKNQSTNQRRSKEQRNAEAIAYRGRSIAPSSKNSTNCTSSPLQMKSHKYRDNSTTVYKENTNKINLYRIVGITNPNLDCFLNSALQCIFCVPEFVEFFVNRQFLFKEQEGDEYKQSKTMKLPGYKYCEAMHKLCYSLA